MAKRKHGKVKSSRMQLLPCCKDEETVGNTKPGERRNHARSSAFQLHTAVQAPIDVHVTNRKGVIRISKVDQFKTISAGAAGSLVFILGGLDEILAMFMVFAVMDFLSGVLSAAYQGIMCSRICFEGIIRKVLMMIVIVVAYGIEHVIGSSFPVREITITFFVISEAISILENVSKTGIRLPKKLLNILKSLDALEQPRQVNIDQLPAEQNDSDTIQ